MFSPITIVKFIFVIRTIVKTNISESLRKDIIDFLNKKASETKNEYDDTFVWILKALFL